MEIVRMIKKLKPKTNHLVFITTNDQNIESAQRDLYANGFQGSGRVFIKNGKRVSVIKAGTPYEGATNYSLVHFSWHDDLGKDLNALDMVRKWETKATEILT